MPLYVAEGDPKETASEEAGLSVECPTVVVSQSFLSSRILFLTSFLLAIIFWCPPLYASKGVAAPRAS